MLKKSQLVVEEGKEDLTAADQFYALAAQLPPDRVNPPHIVSTRKFATEPSCAHGLTTRRQSCLQSWDYAGSHWKESICHP
jgi:hypothetical protein